MPDITSRKTDRLVVIDTDIGHSLYYDPGRGTYHSWYDSEAYEPITTRLLVGVATALETEIADLEALGDHINPDALNALCTHWGAESRTVSGSVSFRYERCQITVDADGEIIIDPRDEVPL
ncbi:HalOD1 output domain-containing protein [Natronolimnobius baerhuensis]|uniref:Halobacterial output domain-containing protein n=1 Tax=Natronolimnobius baerhuensis TaxID=253108 RepID=A0A202E8M0_9EURY|nr:HalOD1 output domain-containing protein [Natronolimnobius baerhuensis]OVE84569.1 hypothetical protein B2G88_09215 [Natronolimnobius baerhuensis]